MLENERFKATIDNITGQLKEGLNQWVCRARSDLCGQRSLSTDYSMYQQLDNATQQLFLHKFRALEAQHAYLDQRTSTLLSILDDTISTGRPPQFFQNAQSLQDAVVRKAMWGDITRVIAYVTGGFAYLLRLVNS